MWWLIPGLVVGAIAAAAAALSGGETTAKKPQQSGGQRHGDCKDAAAVQMFRRNITRLRTALRERSIRPIAIVGSPGAGKSSLLIRLAEGRCEPMPVIGQATDATDWSRSDGVDLLSDAPAIGMFVDVPGIGTARHPVADLIACFPFDVCSAILVAIRGKLRVGETALLRHLVDDRRLFDRVVIVRTFEDALDRTEILDAVADIRSVAGADADIRVVSNRTGSGVADLRNAIRFLLRKHPN